MNNLNNNQRPDDNGYIQSAALSMPGLIRGNAEDGGYQTMLDELATPYLDGAAPSLGKATKDPYINDVDPIAPVEHDSLPELTILDRNRDCATQWKGLYE